jgi:Ca2+-binding RTX toxin-like protein
MTISVQGDYVLPAGQTVTVTNQNGIEVTGDTWRSVTVNGGVSMKLTTGPISAVGIRTLTDDYTSHPTINIGPSGFVDIQALVSSGVGAEGVRAIAGTSLVNQGRIAVSGAIDGWGISSGFGAIDNRGTIAVSATRSAWGLYSDGGGAFTNSGMIDVTATGSGPVAAVGVLIRANTAEFGGFLNTGTITVKHLDPSITSVGVDYAGIGDFVNTGVIAADQALVLERSLGPSGVHLVVNSGVIRGDVILVTRGVIGDHMELRNSGSIVGEVTLDGDGDIYDGTGGSLSTALHGLGGGDSLRGGAGADTLFGDAGDDTISGGAGGTDQLDGGDGVDTLSFSGASVGIQFDIGAQTTSANETFSHFERYAGGEKADTIQGSVANDTFSGGSGEDYLRGGDGADSIAGGSDFDDINGNQGADTAHGDDGDDWVVGGKDNDLLFGDAGHDIVYGNLGDDTVSGDAGADWVRGGQGDDSVSGGAGDDWLWGDRGNDTLSGGAGADIFHSFAGAGLDRITDFSLAEGDRVQLDPGATYAIRQVGADTVIDLGGGDQVVLVGVQAAALAASSVFVG